ncbi:MAG: nitroreductase [Chloroflexi bacterium]|nr:nitroreductase [Chloroflexota bacterium]
MKNHPKIRDRIRKFNKHVLNRMMLKIAGAPHSPISLIRHVGRRSGKSYETPVIVEPTTDGFIFALTYGPVVDWYRNVLAAGQCSLIWHGQEYALEKPEQVDVKTALAAFPPPFRQILGLTGMDDFFKMAISHTETPVKEPARLPSNNA